MSPPRILVAPVESPLRRLIESSMPMAISLHSAFQASVSIPRSTAANGHIAPNGQRPANWHIPVNVRASANGRRAPDVIVIDATKSIQAAIAELTAVRLRYKEESKYLVVGNLCEYDEFIVLIRAGMDGYLRLQDLSPQTLERTFQALLAGEFAIPRSLVGSLVSFVRAPQERTSHNGFSPARDEDGSESELTAREKDVLRLLTMGARNREIAQILVISLATVNKHVQHIFNKLEVHSRTAAMRKVMTHPVEREATDGDSSFGSDLLWMAKVAKQNGVAELRSVTPGKRLIRAG